MACGGRHRHQRFDGTQSDAGGGRATQAGGLLQHTENALHGSHQASANVETVAIAAEELSASIKEISGQLMQANEVARTAAADVSSTNDDIAALVRIARRIGDVVKLIEAIAEQTNLLALNATIEAARAVKPVAVLQWLLRRLSRWLCKQPKQPISSVQASTTGAVTAIGAITRRMQEINAHTTEVVNSVERQELATGEISINVASAASESKVVVAALSDVASGVKQTRSSAETVLNASEEVMTATEKLCGEVEGFLRTVAA